MGLQTKEKIIFALVRKNGQTFTELLQNANTNRDSLSKGLGTWREEDVIKKDDRLYYFSTNIKNPLLLSLKDSYTIIKHLDGFVEKIKKMGNPFPSSCKMICSIMGLQIVLKLERYTVPKLTKREKLEFDLFADIFDAATELIFEVLRKKDKHKTQTLKMALVKTIFGQKLS